MTIRTNFQTKFEVRFLVKASCEGILKAFCGLETMFCSKKRTCGRKKGHPGKCNSERPCNKFWQKSPFFSLRESQGEVSRKAVEITARETERSFAEKDLLAKQEELETLAKCTEEKVNAAEKTLGAITTRKDEVDKEIAEQEQFLKEISVQCEKLKTLLDQKEYSWTRRQNTRTTLETISDGNSSVRYRRRRDTKNVLEYIHGGEEGALLGAWDLIATHAKKELMDRLMGRYKRGKYLESIISHAMKELHQSKESLTQAVAFKYQNFLSHRKFNLICKTQSSVFDANKDVGVPRNVKCLGIDLELSLNNISDESVEKFVKSLDIGYVNQIPSASGVTRTVSGLVFMIVYLHLRLPYLSRRLVWFTENTNHFIFH